MKRTLFATLSALTLSLTATAAFAGEITAIKSQSVDNIVEITPFNLVRRGYQGSFKDQGIPSYGSFIKAAQKGRVTAKDLVKVAIADGRLAPETINDRVYLKDVASFLSDLDEN
ncbi:MAG: hypothetical protein AAF652_11845 [Cyanobacteria bacterium P01_C01_bin.72]